jgi:flagellin
MSSIINTNSLSLVTQNNLSKSQGSLNSAIQRLSSGMRINSAKDDAAGEAIANRFTSNINGLAQAQRNANDGISLSQTTEGALNEVNSNLQRIRELAVQSANGSNSAADRSSIQAEISQRMAEIDRTSAQTDFNGTKVLASDQTLNIQVGASDAQTIEIALQKMDISALGMTGFSVSGLSSAITSFTNTATAGTATKVDVVTADLAGMATILNTASGGTSNTASNISLHGYGAFDATTETYANYAIKDSSGTLYAVAAADVDPDAGTITAFADADAVTAAKTAYAADATAGLSATSNPLATLDAALAKVDTLRGLLGAVQNRFDSVIANLGTTGTNLASSRSRIQDADYAVEVSNMTRANILQQAGTSVLAQANQSTQGVLSLLR